MAWERPSQRVCELIRRGAKMTLDASPRWLDGLDDAALASTYMRCVADDPVIVEAIRKSNRANHLHWAAANISRPGEPVPANLAAEPVAAVRHVVHRGLDEAAVLDAYRLGQNAAWRFWMQTAFRLTTDPAELRELLAVSELSIASFLETTAAGICQQIRIEHDQLTRGTHAERRAIVARILDGLAAPRDAEDRLGYRLGQRHTAAVVWGDAAANLADLDRAAEAVMRAAAGRPLSVLADAATRWVWLPGPDGPDPAAVAPTVAQLAGVCVALGPTAAGIDGFRRSHLDALTTQRMMARPDFSQRVARFTDIELVALITADPKRADRFIKRTLGDFASADTELHQTVLTFVNDQCNASRAAGRLFIHRNTLLRRLSQADRLLPRPLEANSVHVAVALEALHRRTSTG